MKKALSESDIPRPGCACGKPGTHEVNLVVRRLDLDRDAGAHTVPFWTASYKSTTATVTAVVCDECLKRNVNITLTVAASVEKARPS